VTKAELRGISRGDRQRNRPDLHRVRSMVFHGHGLFCMDAELYVAEAEAGRRNRHRRAYEVRGHALRRGHGHGGGGAGGAGHASGPLGEQIIRFRGGGEIYFRARGVVSASRRRDRSSGGRIGCCRQQVTGAEGCGVGDCG
jgi:hypothetical protein